MSERLTKHCDYIVQQLLCYGHWHNERIDNNAILTFFLLPCAQCKTCKAVSKVLMFELFCKILANESNILSIFLLLILHNINSVHCAVTAVCN